MPRRSRRLADALRVDYVAILELGQEKKILTLRAGHGWQKGVVGTAQLNASDQSQAGFTILANEPVLLTGLGADKRFAGEPLLKRHGVVSGITLTIGGQSNRYGVLGIYCKHKREFAADEVRFLRTIASVLATAGIPRAISLGPTSTA